MITMKINNVDPEILFGAGMFKVNKIKGRGPINRDISLMTVPGRDGAYLQRARTPERELEVTITLKGTDLQDLRAQVEKLNELAVTDEAIPIEFSDEERTYYGILSDKTDWEEIRNFGQGTLKFVCPDPHKYGDELIVNFLNDGAGVLVDGSAGATPVFKFNILKDTTVLMAADDKGNYMAIGREYGLDQTPYVREQLILDDSCTTTTGWTPGLNVEGGAVSGTMSVSPNGQDFIASNYGTGSTWHGPALVKGLSEPVQDFRAEIYLNLLAYQDPRTIGRVELYLLDINGNTVAKLSMANAWTVNNHNQAEIVLGGAGDPDRRFMVQTKGKTPIWWNNFTSGLLRLERIGSRFYAYVANRTGDLRHYRVWGTGYTDSGNAHSLPIAQVQVHIGAYGTYSTPTQGINLVRMYKINQQPDDVPYIARAGDEVIFDHQTRDILVNGESRLDAKDFGGRFFDLEPGVTNLAVAPIGVSDTSAIWRDKYR